MTWIARPGSVWRSMSPRKSRKSTARWINVDGSGQIKGSGYSGGGLKSSTMVKIGPVLHRFLAVKLPDLRAARSRATAGCAWSPGSGIWLRQLS